MTHYHCLPNLILAFASKKNKDKYAVIAIVLLLVSLVLHLLKIQQLPLLELSPFLLSLLFIYGMIYRKNKKSPDADDRDLCVISFFIKRYQTLRKIRHLYIRD